jgi:hypothetical protein
LEHLLELLQTQLSPRRRATIQARVQALQQQLSGNPQSGEGIISDTIDAVKSGASKVGQYAKAVVFGRGEVYPPKVRTLIEKFGTSKITSAELRRSPVQSLLTSAMNALTFGKFKKNMSQTPYDQLFHLQIVLTLENGTKLLLEKNEVINMDVLTSQSLPKGTEVLPITPFTSVVLNDALEKTKASMGSKAYFDYNAENNNCQDFISSFLKANGIGGASDYAFVKQDTKKLFKGLSGLAKTAYTLTELGERANVALTGAGMTSSKIADKETEDLKERLDKKMTIAKATKSTLYKKAMKAEKEASKTKKVMSGKGGGSSKEVVIPKKETYTQADIDKLLADNERLRMINSAIKEKKEVGIGKKVAKKMTDNMTSADFNAIEAKGRDLEGKFKDAPKPKPLIVKKQVSSDAVSNFANILKSASGKMAGKGAKSSKIAPSNAVEEVQPVIGESRIGSTETSRLPRAVAVAPAPMAQSYPVEEELIRQRLRSINRSIQETERSIRNIQMRISRDLYYFGGEDTRARANDIETIENLMDELNSLYRIEGEFLSRITPTEATIEGEGIGSNYVVQSVIFKNEMFSVSKAKKWLKEHKYKVVKVDKTSGMLRFRQIDPMEVENMGYTEYRTKSLGNSGVELVLVYKPTKMMGKGASSSANRNSPPPSPPPTPPPTPRLTDLQRAQADREWDDRAHQLERRERMFALSQARSQLRDTQEQLNQASSAINENRLYNLAGFLQHQISLLEAQLGLIEPNDITEREAYVPATIGSDSMTDDSDRTETEKYKSGRGIFKPLPKGFKGSGVVRF